MKDFIGSLNENVNVDDEAREEGQEEGEASEEEGEEEDGEEEETIERDQCMKPAATQLLDTLVEAPDELSPANRPSTKKHVISPVGLPLLLNIALPLKAIKGCTRP